MRAERKIRGMGMRELKDILDTPCKLFCRDSDTNTDIPFEGVLALKNKW